jgi:hypothetical protein
MTNKDVKTITKNKKDSIKKSKKIQDKTKKEKLLIDKIYCIALEKRLDYMKKTLINYYNFPKYKITFIKPYLHL